MLALLVVTLLGQSAEIIYEPNVPDAGMESGLAGGVDAGVPVEPDGGVGATSPAASKATPPGIGNPSDLNLSEEPRGRSFFRGAVELMAQTLPSGPTGGRQDVFANLLPLISVDTGDTFGFELGATLRLRAFDDPPAQRGSDIAGLLRREDWDERSDYGQVLRDLWIGSADSTWQVRAGPMRAYSLGRGLAVSRYSNRLNPDYHPAGATAAVDFGPARLEVMASDLLAPRLLAAELVGDVGEFIGAGPEVRGKYHTTFTFAHDFGLAGGVTPPISVLLFEADAALYRGDGLQAYAYGGLGSRLFSANYALGAMAGVSLDGDLGETQVGAKLEARKVGGSFRFGMFGPAYELGRFSDVGLSLTGTSETLLPDAWSGYLELQADLGRAAELSTSRDGALVASAAVEAFSFGRIDVDAAITARVPGDTASFTGRFTLVGLNVQPRWQGSGEVRFRFMPSLYGIAQAGLVFFPQPDGTLNRGIFGGLGVGADFAN